MVDVVMTCEYVLLFSSCDGTPVGNGSGETITGRLLFVGVERGVIGSKHGSSLSSVGSVSTMLLVVELALEDTVFFIDGNTKV